MQPWNISHLRKKKQKDSSTKKFYCVSFFISSYIDAITIQFLNCWMTTWHLISIHNIIFVSSQNQMFLLSWASKLESNWYQCFKGKEKIFTKMLVPKFCSFVCLFEVYLLCVHELFSKSSSSGLIPQFESMGADVFLSRLFSPFYIIIRTALIKISLVEFTRFIESKYS